MAIIDGSSPPSSSRSDGPRTGPAILGTIGIGLLAVGTWMFVTGVIGTVDSFTEAFDSATNPTREMEFLTDVPGSATGSLDVGTYQLIAIGPNLTRTETNPGGIIDSDVVPLSFARPDVAINGPDGAVDIGATTVTQLVDAPAGDAVSFGEFSVDVAGDYTLTAAGDSPAVRQVGVDDRPDIGAAVSKTVVDGGKILLGGFAATFGFIFSILALIWWRVGRRRHRSDGYGGPTMGGLSTPGFTTMASTPWGAPTQTPPGGPLPPSGGPGVML